ncbi:hypothetical protein ACFV2Q_06885 [Streptomyces sp. NPDC059650]
MGALTVSGYLDEGDGRFDTFSAGVNGASTPTADVAGVEVSRTTSP